MSWSVGVIPVDPAIVEIGWWWAQCCELDLDEIKTAEDLAYVRELIDEDDSFLAGAWPNRDRALEALASP